MYDEYDGCSDFLFEEGTCILQVCPPDDNALKHIKEYIKDHNLTKEDVKIVQSKEFIKLVAITDVTMTLLHEGRAPWDLRGGDLESA